MNGNRVAAIVVTFNRLEMLKECIQCLRHQSRRPELIIVINNNSNDGTKEWLLKQNDLITVNQENLGSSGGQWSGIVEAYKRGYDWFWCMDDDTAATQGALECLLTSPAALNSETGFLASLVLWKDGSVHKMNAPWILRAVPFKNLLLPSHAKDEINWIKKIIENKQVRVKQASFVSLMVSRKVIEKVGLPLRNMFIWHDDAEFTDRISRFFHGYLIFESIVYHNTIDNIGPVVCNPNESQIKKYLYGVKNMIVALRSENTNEVIKFIKISIFVSLIFLRVFLGKAPIQAVNNIFKGFIFSIKPDRIEDYV
jgi:GT2 family glycosyltransferase